MKDKDRSREMLEIWWAYGIAESEFKKENFENWLKEKMKDKEIIIETLQKGGVKKEEIYTDGLVFEFSCKEMDVEFMNFAGCFVGWMCINKERELSKTLIRNIFLIAKRDIEIYSRFKRDFFFEDFFLVGDPKTLVEEVLKKTKEKIKLIEKRQ